MEPRSVKRGRREGRKREGQRENEGREVEVGLTLDHSCALDLGVVLSAVLATKAHDYDLPEEGDRSQQQAGDSLQKERGGVSFNFSFPAWSPPLVLSLDSPARSTSCTDYQPPEQLVPHPQTSRRPLPLRQLPQQSGEPGQLERPPARQAFRWKGRN